MRPPGVLLRPFVLRRTVRLRMTLLYGALFVVSGVVLLTIAGSVSRVSSAGVTKAPAAEQVRPAGHTALAQADSQVRRLQAALAQARNQAHPGPLHQLLVGSLVALLIMGVVSAVLGWLVAGRALRPLRQMTATARRISEDSLHERLAFAGPDDELKQLADTIDDLLERLESAFAAQRRFVANASHELRTPLATMRASLDVAMAKPDPVPAQTAALAARLRTELDRVDELLEGFLVLARVQHGALPGGDAFELGAVVSAVLAEQAGAAAARSIAVRADLAEGAQVAGSEALVGQLIVNLVGNAIGHNELAGWISVTVSAADKIARLTVDNGGRLLDQGQVAQLGQPFRRLGGDRIGSDTGSGLGLSIVAAIAAAHGGSLQLQARPEGGLRAEVAFPLAIVGPAADAADQANPPAPAGTRARAAGAPA